MTVPKDPDNANDERYLTSDLGGYGRIPRALLRASDLSPRARLLFGVLEDYADSTDGSRIFPGRKTLSTHLGCSMKTLDRAKSELEDSGWVTVTHRYDNSGRQKSSLYRLRSRPQRKAKK